MKIVLLHGSSRKELNSLLYNCLNSSVKKTDQVINLGTLPEDSISLSYLDISLMISILIESKSCDFVVVGKFLEWVPDLFQLYFICLYIQFC